MFSQLTGKKKKKCLLSLRCIINALLLINSLADTSLIHPLTHGSVCKTGTARLPRCSFASTSPGILLCVRRPVLACFTVTFSLTYSLGRGSKLLEILNIFSENDRLVVANHSLGLLIRVGWDPSMHSPVQIKTDFFFSFD